MQRISFGDGAGHLMNRLLAHAGIGEVDGNTVLIQPEGDAEAMELLREAAEGGWIVELLGNKDEVPDTGRGVMIRLRAAGPEGIGGERLDYDTLARTGEYALFELSDVEKVHFF